MTRKQLRVSRRQLLFGTSTIGVASLGAGVGSYARFTDTERSSAVVTAGALDLAVHYESVYNGETTSLVSSGRVDGNPGVAFDLPSVVPGDSGRSRFCFELQTNPAYLWLCAEKRRNDEMGQTEPEAAVDETGGNPGEGNGELGDAVDVALRYADQSGNPTQTIVEGTLQEVLDRLEDGIPLDGDGRARVLPEGTQQPFAPSESDGEVVEPCLVFEWDIDWSTGNEIQTDRYGFGLTFHAQQARHNDGTENPCDGTDDGDGGDDQDGGGNDDDASGRKAISFVAFCVEDGRLTADDVTDITVTETNDGGEPLALSWESSVAIDSVVLKTGGGELAIENFPGGTSGTAVVGDGSTRRTGQTPSEPCPGGNAVKFEFDDDSGTFVAE